MKNKIINMMWAVFAIAIAAFLFTACKKDDPDPPMDLIKTSSATLSGAAETPAVASTGTGTINVSYNTGTKIISYTVTWQLGSSTATTVNMHFHGAEDGSDLKSSPVTIGITGFSTASSGTLSGTTRPLTQVEENQLLAGKWYFNVHSSTVPGGELRGNLKF